MLTRQYAKLCDVADFADPALLGAARAILPERDPLAHVERKVWEQCMLAMALEDLGRLHRGTRALAVGAGDERIVFWLANRLGEVVATDVYGEGAFAEGEASASMLSDPAAHAPFPYDEERLDVRWMDARSLDFPDASFDVVFSVSSLEHLGGVHQTARAAAEIGRVLRPGGHAILITECFLRRHPLDAAPVDAALRALTLNRRYRGATPWRRVRLGEVFTRRELRRGLIAPSGLELMQPLDTRISAASWDNVTRQHLDGRLEPRAGTRYPHIVVRLGAGSDFTSACLPLVKPG